MLVAECSAVYAGRLRAELPVARRLLLLKADGSIAIHSDDRAYKPLNWMTPPVSCAETPEKLVFTNKQGEVLTIELHEVISDTSVDLGSEPGLVKDGVEAQLQVLLAAHPEKIEAGLSLVQREYPTGIGPVDLLCRDAEGEHVVVEIKRLGEIQGVEQLSRYMEQLSKDPALLRPRPFLVAQRFKPQAKVLAEVRGITCVTVDYDELQGLESNELLLF